MRKLLTITLFISIAHNSALSGDPAGSQRHTLPPVAGTMAPSASVSVHLPAPAVSTVLQNGTTNISAGKVEQKTTEESITFLLTAHPKIEHSSKRNGAFTVSADRIQLSVPADGISERLSHKASYRQKNPPKTRHFRACGTGSEQNLYTISDFDATGSCVFSSDSIRVSAQRMVFKSLTNGGRSTITFDGDILILFGKEVTASAESITLTRIGAAWVISGLLAQP